MPWDLMHPREFKKLLYLLYLPIRKYLRVILSIFLTFLKTTFKFMKYFSDRRI